jgi:hypothetical protein
LSGVWCPVSDAVIIGLWTGGDIMGG